MRPAQESRPRHPRDQRPPKQRWPADRADLHVIKAELGERLGQRTPRVQVQVIAERLREPRDPANSDAHAAVRRRRQQQPAAGCQHAPHLREPAGRVRDVLDHLAAPNELERVLIEGERSFDRDEAEIEIGMPGARPAQRSLRHLHADRLHPARCEERGEFPGAATEVERPVSGPGLAQQEVPSALEVRRLEFVREPVPQVFVVVLHRATVSCKLTRATFALRQV